MKLSFNWLKEYVDISVSPKELAEKLTLAGIEVETVAYLGEGLEGVVVGEIKDIAKHPSADRLSLAQVDIGTRTIQVVFGQRAVLHIGDKVPVAVAPTKLPGGEIKVTKIRGERSDGMFCLDSELKPELSDTVTYFPKETAVGKLVIDVFGWNDVVLELSITPNRGDCFSVLGIAREVAALYKIKLKKDPRKDFASIDATECSNQHIQIAIDDFESCYKFCALYMSGIKVGDSPNWLKHRLAAVGIRSISNIVDITNYIMMDLGQPLHPFDAKNVVNNFISVRKARSDEEIITLDGKNRILDDSVLVLADTEKVLDVAGIMGGKETEISETTTDIILVACVFQPSAIRKAYRNLGLRTEAAIRFEKGIDWHLREASLLKTAQMIQELTGGRIEDGIIKVSKPDPEPVRFLVSLDYINTLLGRRFSIEEAHDILERLGIYVEHSRSLSDASMFSVTIPSWRHDLAIPADIAEEVGRLADYNTIKKIPITGEIIAQEQNGFFHFKRKMRDTFSALGYAEAYTYSFYGELEAKWQGGQEKHLEVINAIASSERYLRASLAPLLLRKASTNARMYDSVKIFELGTIFKPGDSLLPNEETSFACALSVDGVDSYTAYRMMKGDCEAIFRALGIGDVSYVWHGEKISVFSAQKQRPPLTPTSQWGEPIGEIFVASERDKAVFKFRQEAVLFAGNAQLLFALARQDARYEPIPIFPSAIRDLSFIVPESVRYRDVVQVLQSASAYCADIALIDEFSLDNGSRSLTLRIIFSATDRTLEGNELQKIEQIMIESARQLLGLELRGAV